MCIAPTGVLSHLDALTPQVYSAACHAALCKAWHTAAGLSHGTPHRMAVLCIPAA